MSGRGTRAGPGIPDSWNPQIYITELAYVSVLSAPHADLEELETKDQAGW